jgi:Na+-transporting NADH:ubiquinone oxidoreductase subunit NqrC
MLTALLIVGTIAVICLIAGIVLVAVVVSQSLQKQADVLDRAHNRFIEQTKDLHDRLMAKSPEQYLELRAFSTDDEGGFYTPDEQAPERPESDDEEEIEQLLPTRWGTMSVVSDIPRPDAAEERLLAEDFEDDGEAVTDEERRYKQAKDRGVV